MKNILLNVLAFVVFLAIEIVAVAFMSTYPAGSAAMMLLGLLALVIGGAYTVLLGRDIVNLKL
jgi:thiamine transporter ThiT